MIKKIVLIIVAILVVAALMPVYVGNTTSNSPVGTFGPTVGTSIPTRTATFQYQNAIPFVAKDYVYLTPTIGPTERPTPP